MADAIELLARFDPFGPAGERAGERGLRPYLLVDVFTDAPLEGNPLAVVTDAREMAAAQMQRLARELNLSETIFVLPARGDGDVRVRIFTPAAELPFAGHPVLGCAILLASARASTDFPVPEYPPMAISRGGSGAINRSASAK